MSHKAPSSRHAPRRPLPASATASACSPSRASSASRSTAAGVVDGQARRLVDARTLDHPGARQARHLPVHERRRCRRWTASIRSRCSTSTTGSRCRAATVATERKTGTLLKSPFTFKKYGQSGIEVSELFPHVGECADDICFVRSVYTDIPNHEPSMLMMNTGHTQAGRPSLGSWLTYGLGTDNKNLPGLRRALPRRADDRRAAALEQRVPAGGASGHVHLRQDRAAGSDHRQGLRSEEARVVHQQPGLHAAANSGASWTCSRSSTRCARPAKPRDPQLEAAINSMEVAYRMQTEAPDVFDIRKESEATLKLYGTGSTARGCLMAVRLVEKRRAHGAGLLRQGRSLGSPQRHPAAPQEREGLRSAVRGGDQGPEVTRPVQGHARRLRLGIRPHAGRRSRRRRRHRRRTAAITIRSASRCGWPAAASRAA